MGNINCEADPRKITARLEKEIQRLAVQDFTRSLVIKDYITCQNMYG